MVTLVEPGSTSELAVEPASELEKNKKRVVWLYRMPFAGVKYYYYHDIGPAIVPPGDLDRWLIDDETRV